MLSRDDIEKYAAEGREAFEMGMSLDHCPYSQSSAAFSTWLRGYCNASFGANVSRDRWNLNT